MIKKKVCLLGAPAVGKSSLVRRFVHGIFDERYLSTIGVKIDRKSLEVGSKAVTLMVWDLHGEEESAPVRGSYLRATAGALLVADGTRPATLESLRALHQRTREVAGDIPFLVCLNKSDLVDDFLVTDADVRAAGLDELPLLRTSALDGSGVERAFAHLASRLVEG